MDLQKELNPEIQSVINMLYDITPLTQSDFSVDDNIRKSIQDMLDSVLWSLGSDFDEAISLMLKESFHYENELMYHNGIAIKLHDDYSSKKYLITMINSFLHDLNLNPYEMNYKELTIRCNEYADKFTNDSELITVSSNDLHNLLKWIEEKKNEVYESSKKLVKDINLRIEYNFVNNDQLLKNSCYQALSAILFLVSYYIKCITCFRRILVIINSDLDKSLNVATTE